MSGSSGTVPNAPHSPSILGDSRTAAKSAAIALKRVQTRTQWVSPEDMVASGEDPTLLVLAMKEKEEVSSQQFLQQAVDHSNGNLLHGLHRLTKPSV